VTEIGAEKAGWHGEGHAPLVLNICTTLTEEAPMVSTSRFIGGLAVGCLLGLGLSSCYTGPARDAASATDEIEKNQSDRSSDTKAIKGEVLRVEGHNYVVKGEDGKEVSLHTDSTTLKTGDIRQGYNIEAQVNDRNHALSIRSTPTTDRRNEKLESMLAQ
jgi:hypothetical protein